MSSSTIVDHRAGAPLIFRLLGILLILVTPCLAGESHEEQAADQSKNTAGLETPDPPMPALTAMESKNSADDSDAARGDLPPAAAAPPIKKAPRQGVRWGGVLSQSMLFLSVEQGYRLGTQPGTREALKGPFFEDWFESVKATHGWDDGDDFLANYIGHPMQGSVTAFIFAQNDPKGIRQEFAWTSGYWNSRLKATAWSAVYSTQFELGIFSEASIGNVGHFGKSESGYVDLVMTPLAGLGWQVGEDALDKYLIQRIESWTRNRVVLILARGFLNPTRSFANVMRIKVPWHRDTRPGIWGRNRPAPDRSQ